MVEGHHGAVAGTVSAKWPKGTGGPSGDETQNLIAFNSREDPDVTGAVAGPVGASLPQAQAVAFTCKDYGADAGGVSPTLRSMNHDGSHANGGGQVAVAIQERAVSENPASGPDGAGCAEDIAYTIEALPTAQAVAFKPSHFTCGKDGAPADLFPPLSADADKGDQDPVVACAEPYTLAIRGREGGHDLEYRRDGTANAILTPNGGRGGIGVGAFASATVIRRITPREAERLQGFPDDHTLIEWPSAHRKPDDLAETIAYLTASGYSDAEAAHLARTPDGPRYKAIGNSMATKVMRWLLTRCIASVEGRL